MPRTPYGWTLRMTTPDISAAPSRLCTACGMCCDGVMFHTVHLKPGDSPKGLAALGLKLKRKRGQNYILQPCPAYRESQCSIYAVRPERCRLFECGQLRRVAAGEITEAMALQKIDGARRLVTELNALLLRAGGTNVKRPLSKRCEQAMAVPLDPTSDIATVEIRERLTRTMQELEKMLDQDFRITPAEPDPGEPSPGLPCDSK
jgi:Fe-S-cluster containining protein